MVSLANLCPKATPEEIAASIKRKQSSHDLLAPPAKKPAIEAAVDDKVVDKLKNVRVVLVGTQQEWNRNTLKIHTCDLSYELLRVCCRGHPITMLVTWVSFPIA